MYYSVIHSYCPRKSPFNDCLVDKLQHGLISTVCAQILLEAKNCFEIEFGADLLAKKLFGGLWNAVLTVCLHTNRGLYKQYCAN